MIFIKVRDVRQLDVILNAKMISSIESIPEDYTLCKVYLDDKTELVVQHTIQELSEKLVSDHYNFSKVNHEHQRQTPQNLSPDPIL